MEDNKHNEENTDINASDDNSVRRAKEVRERAIREAKAMEEKAKQDAIEAKERAKREAREAEEARKAEQEARKEADRVAKEKAKQDAIEAKERAKREAREAEEARKAEQEARKEAERVAKEKAKQEAEEVVEIQIIKSEKGTVKAQEIDKGAVKIGYEMFKGMVKLLIAPPVDSKHMKELEGNLQQTKGLRLILVGGTADGGMQIVISVKKPTPLLKILFNMASVEEASGKGDEIRVSLK